MNATKYTVTISMEVLSKDVIPSLLQDAADLLSKEINSAYLSHDDGDCVSIKVEALDVTI